MCFICFSTVVWYNVISAEKNKRRQGRHLFFASLLTKVPSASADRWARQRVDLSLRRKRNKRRQCMELSLYRNEKGHPFAYVPFYHQSKCRLRQRMEGMESHRWLYGPAQYWIRSGSDKRDRWSQRNVQGIDQGSRKALLPYCCWRRRHHEWSFRWSFLPWSFKSGLYPGRNRKWLMAKSSYAGKSCAVSEKAALPKALLRDRLRRSFLWKRRTISQAVFS